MYPFIFKLCIQTNLAEVFSLYVNSRMSKFPPCTRLGRLSITKHVRNPKRTVGIIYPCTEKKFINLNPVDKNFAVRNFTGYINVVHL